MRSEVGVGVDATSVARVAALLERRPRFAERCFTEAERRDCAGMPRRWASTWAAKEAVRKLFGAAGTSPLPAFAGIEVRRGDGGAPRVAVAGAGDIALTLTHEGDLAVAVAVASTPSPRPLLPLPDGLRLAERPDDANKGTFGTVVVIGGAHGFSGAPYLAAMGAARAGAGLVRLCVPESLFAIAATKCVEVMAHPLPDGGAGRIGPEAVEPLRTQHLGAARAVVLGPGLGRDEATRRAVPEVLRALRSPGVVDADGLNVAVLAGFDWHEAAAPLVLTPHPAEMGRLAGIDTAAVQAARDRVAHDFAAEHGVVVVLKGAETLVAAPDGRLHRSAARLVALATGGTGDVLGGVVAAMLSQGLEPFDAAVAAVGIHAEAGAAVQRLRGRAGALAGDLLEELPAAQERLRRALERAT